MVAGAARFTFLTPSLVRMEYAPGGHFTDAPTAVAIRREWPKVAVEIRHEGDWLVLASSAVTLRYRNDGRPFDASNLRVDWKRPRAGGPASWVPGQRDPGNLGGLTYSLDNIAQANLPGGDDLQSPVGDLIPGIDVLLPKARPGLLSRSGYALIDDSGTPVWNLATKWIKPRPRPWGQDWYLFTYDRDYPAVLRDYAALCGPVPMLPRYALGTWITDLNFEYFPDAPQAHDSGFLHYGAAHLQEQVARLKALKIPLDVLVLDFAWHNYGWDGGFDWSPLMAHPKAFLDALQAQGVRVGLNDHPGYANTPQAVVAHADSHAPAALAALGRPPDIRPTFQHRLPTRWQFAIDPADRGMAGHWFEPAVRAPWKAVAIGKPWEKQGHADYRGAAWYRLRWRAPVRLPDQAYLVFGEVGGTYRLFVNGSEVPHSDVHWPQRITFADVRKRLRPGQDTTVVLRVTAGERGSGLIGPRIVLQDVAPPERIFFDLSDQRQAQASMTLLHDPLLAQGASFWWVDGGNGAATMPGLDPQLWTNKVFYDASAKATGQRAMILSRYGGWGSERYPVYFTGDTYSEWPVLRYEVAYTTRAGNVGVPWVSHDIGGFHGGRIPYELYARWIEFGTFSPILRLHSAHANPLEGNTRMPWNYGDRGVAFLRRYFDLRRQLVPYLYSLGWAAHTQALPLQRPLYLVDPADPEAYRHPHEYYFGDQLLVAPVTAPGGRIAVYLPPGDWFDFFSGERRAGGRTVDLQVPVESTPVFARDGAIVAGQPATDSADGPSGATLLLDLFGTANGHFELYEDDGRSLDYDRAHALTAIDYAHEGRLGHLRVAASVGDYPGKASSRAYEVRLHAVGMPGAPRVNGAPLGAWQWNARTHVATLQLSARDIGTGFDLSWAAPTDAP